MLGLIWVQTVCKRLSAQGGYCNIFKHMLARAILFWVKILYFHIFLVFRKMKRGMKSLWIYFGGHHKIGLVLEVISMYF